MTTKPIVLWGHAGGPNPWKVAIIMEELNVNYEHKMLDFSELKKDPYESLNPNGRVPAIQDPNTGITVWESGACIDYLLENYDTQHRLTPIDIQQKWAARSWRDFQMSGQGPYFGQVVFFRHYHSENVPSVIERFQKEVKRVVGVIDRHLKKAQSMYLTGEHLAYSDLMWVPWTDYVPTLLPDGTDIVSEYPHFNAWWQRISSRPSVQKIKKAKEEAMKAQAH